MAVDQMLSDSDVVISTTYFMEGDEVSVLVTARYAILTSNNLCSLLRYIICMLSLWVIGHVHTGLDQRNVDGRSHDKEEMANN